MNSIEVTAIIGPIINKNINIFKKQSQQSLAICNNLLIYFFFDYIYLLGDYILFYQKKKIKIKLI